jgi:probable DNA metabolism protein
VWESAADAQTALALGGAGEVRAARDPGADPLALDLDGEVTAAPDAAARRRAGRAPPTVRVPKRFLALASLVACHRDAGRWGALYRVLWRLTLGGEPRLLEVSVDGDVLRLTGMAKAVRREVHKMHAFVRFRAVGAAPDGAGAPPADAEYVAWFEPEHHVVERAAAFFARRFPNTRWAILTPRGCARWDGRALAFGPGVERAAAAGDDALEALWGTYYAHVFNPARLKLAAMRSEMPKKYWRNLPEARLIDGMVREAPARVRRMVEAAGGTAGPPAAPPSAAGPGAGGASAGGPDVVGRTWSGGGGTAGRGEARTGGAAPMPLGIGVARVGTASWTDPTLTAPGVWYPDDARTPDARLRYYATQFPLVEVDSTYYALPTRRVAELWAERAPDGFVFDVKAHAAMTGHPVEPARLARRVRDLLPPSLAARTRLLGDELPARVHDAVWADFLDALAPLADGGRMGAVFLQFPRWFTPSRANADALRAARDRLGTRLAAVEFRHRDWFAPRVAPRTLALLERLGFAHTVVDAPPGFASTVPAVAEVTHPALAVVRLHGRRRDTWEQRGAPVIERYRYEYSAAELEALVPAVEAVAGRAAETHVVFNNHYAHYAPSNAAAFAAMLQARGAAG